MKSQILIYHHLGLGDHIICNGLVRHFAEVSEVLLLCKYSNYYNVKFMYRDNPNIKIYKINNDNEANNVCMLYPNIMRVGFAVGGKRHENSLWDENFYLNAGIDFNYSWSKFHFDEDHSASETIFNKLNPLKEDYIFIHNIDSHNKDRIDYSIINQNKKWIISDQSIPFFNYYSIINNASEIHCIDSSFKHLIDRIPTTGNLYYHTKKEPKKFDKHNMRKNWILV